MRNGALGIEIEVNASWSGRPRGPPCPAPSITASKICSIQNLDTAGLLDAALGAVAGTSVGAATRGRLAKEFEKDLPVALLEDVAAIVISIVRCQRASRRTHRSAHQTPAKDAPNELRWHLAAWRIRQFVVDPSTNATTMNM